MLNKSILKVIEIRNILKITNAIFKSFYEIFQSGFNCMDDWWVNYPIITDDDFIVQKIESAGNFEFHGMLN